MRLPPAPAIDNLPRAAQPAQASVGSERCPSAACAARGTATSPSWATGSQGLGKHREEDPSLPDLLGFALFDSCFSSSCSQPLSSLLQGGRESNQVTSLQRSNITPPLPHHYPLLMAEQHADPPGDEESLGWHRLSPRCVYLLTNISPQRC